MVAMASFNRAGYSQRQGSEDIVMGDSKVLQVRVFTTHGTVLYVDLTSGELRHGLAAVHPTSVKILSDGAHAQIMHVVAATLQPISFLVNHSRSGGAVPPTTPTLFEIVQLDRGLVGLKSEGLFLCAEDDGRITLSRKDCRKWESFELRETSSSPALKIAAFTMAYNEPIFLPIWRRYYGDAIGEQNLYLLDHGSNDASTASLGAINRVRIPRDDFDEEQRATFVSRFQASLLCYYDIVIFSDVDEILIPDPDKFSGLPEFVKHRCDQFVTAIGIEVQHLCDIEADIKLDRPILSQRRYVRFAADYCKPLISRIPLAWEAGFHSCNYPPSVDRDLFLFHLKLMDRKLATEQLRKARNIRWSENALRKNHSFQNRLNDHEFTSSMFPYSAETIKPLLVEGFDFSIDLERFVTDRPNLFQNFKGAVAAIPERFHNAIKPGANAINREEPAEVTREVSMTSFARVAGEGPTTSLDNRDHGRANLVIVEVGASGGLKDNWQNADCRITAVLFELNPTRAAELRAMTSAASKVIVIEEALANVAGKRKLNKTKSLGRWSLRQPNAEVLSPYSINPAFEVRSTEEIDVTTYASLFREGKVPLPDVIRIDVPGFEFEVLAGFGDLLGGCIAIELETHLYEIYKGQKLFQDTVRYLMDFGFSLRRLCPTGLFDGDIVELDGWFTASHSRTLTLDETSRNKLKLVEREWGLAAQRRQFDATQWDHEWSE